MEYISREDYCEENCGKENREGYKTCKNCSMLNVPSADVQPVMLARWIDLDNRILCSGCGAGYDDSDEVKQSTYIFCPNCGARMNSDAE